MKELDPSSDSKSRDLQAEINRLAEELGVRPLTVEFPPRTADDINIFVDDDGTYHFAYYERGKVGFDRVGSLDHIRYWYCENVVHDLSRGIVDRKERFLFEYQTLSRHNPDWGKRYVRDLAEFFRSISKPQDLALLPDIGESL
ncbi:hypothetical protein DVS77_17510 [Mycolicibacterium moriokaense]|nr:hypothetical protein DVS77_17510 [Mycolicibacterium moriokaense]